MYEIHTYHEPRKKRPTVQHDPVRSRACNALGTCWRRGAQRLRLSPADDSAPISGRVRQSAEHRPEEEHHESEEVETVWTTPAIAPARSLVEGRERRNVPSGTYPPRARSASASRTLRSGPVVAAPWLSPRRRSARGHREARRGCNPQRNPDAESGSAPDRWLPRARWRIVVMQS